MPLVRVKEPFDSPDWIFEVKHDGWRGMAYIGAGKCEIVSRNGNALRSFPSLCSELAAAIVKHAVIDGEIVHLGPDGRALFYPLMRRRPPFHFYAFDLLALDGEDLRARPLVERKALLKRLVRPPMLFVDHVKARGVDLFRTACEHDLEGVVAKLAKGTYDPENPTWRKIKNPKYSQMPGRHELFDRKRR